MRKKVGNVITSDLLECLEDRHLRNEVTLEDHCLIRILSGEIRIVSSDTNRIFTKGNTFFLPRRQLITTIKKDKDNEKFKCVLIILRKDQLKKYYTQYPANRSTAHSQTIKSYENHPLLESYFSSLPPYFEIFGELPDHLISLKIDEAVTILRTIDVNIDADLADFTEQGKIDLEEFMERNYMFNMPLEKFGYLTGRSLTTFKRDFHKIYGTTPQRWLTKKRLKLAYYLISKDSKKPAEIYRDAGFENLSHFSNAFKKQFGFAPNTYFKNYFNDKIIE